MCSGLTIRPSSVRRFVCWVRLVQFVLRDLGLLQFVLQEWAGVQSMLPRVHPSAETRKLGTGCVCCWRRGMLITPWISWPRHVCFELGGRPIA